MIELGKIYESVKVKELNISRDIDSFLVSFDFKSSGEDYVVRLVGVREIDLINELFESNRIWIKRDEESQLEYGSYLLGLSGENYTEISFDSLGT